MIPIMQPLEYLDDVCRSLALLALDGRFAATLEAENTLRGGEASPVDFHGAVHGRSYRVTYTSTPGEFGLSILAGATQNGLRSVRFALSSMPRGQRIVAREYVCTGSDDDSQHLSGFLFVVLSAGSPNDFRAAS